MPHRQLMEDRLRFLNIDQNSIVELRKARDILEPAIDDILDQFYAHLLNEPELHDLFKDQASIDRARSGQKSHWMDALFNGKYDNAYYEKTSRIGQAHANVGLTPNWYIGSYSLILGQFIELITDKYADKGESAIQLIREVSKIIFLDMDLVIHSYLDAKDSTMRRILEHATDFKDEMWASSDNLNALVTQIKATAEVLSEETATQFDTTASKDSTQPNNAGDILQRINELIEKTEELNRLAVQLDENLKKQPLSDTLYLPEPGIFTRLKTKLFEKAYHHKNTP